MPVYLDAVRILGTVLSSIYLAGCAAEDFLTRKIRVGSSVCAGIAAVFLLLVKLAESGDLRMELGSAALSLLPGLSLLLVAATAKGAAGCGDGLCYLVLGLFLGARTVWLILMVSLFMAAFSGIMLLLLHKAGRKTRLPFLAVSAGAWAVILTSRLAGVVW